LGTKQVYSALEGSQLSHQPLPDVDAAAVAARPTTLPSSARPLFSVPLGTAAATSIREDTAELPTEDTLSGTFEHSRRLSQATPPVRDLCCWSASDDSFVEVTGNTCLEGYTEFNWPDWLKSQGCTPPPLHSPDVCCVKKKHSKEVTAWESTSQECKRCESHKGYGANGDITFKTHNWTTQLECTGKPVDCRANDGPFGA
jgi:hypothetical protein